MRTTQPTRLMILSRRSCVCSSDQTRIADPIQPTASSHQVPMGATLAPGATRLAGIRGGPRRPGSGVGRDELRQDCLEPGVEGERRQDLALLLRIGRDRRAPRRGPQPLVGRAVVARAREGAVTYLVEGLLGLEDALGVEGQAPLVRDEIRPE